MPYCTQNDANVAHTDYDEMAQQKSNVQERANPGEASSPKGGTGNQAGGISYSWQKIVLLDSNERVAE
jgi:hypothetical protein